MQNSYQTSLTFAEISLPMQDPSIYNEKLIKKRTFKGSVLLIVALIWVVGLAHHQTVKSQLHW